MSTNDPILSSEQEESPSSAGLLLDDMRQPSDDSAVEEGGGGSIHTHNTSSSRRRNNVEAFQPLANLLAHCFALCALLVVCRWVFQMGGLSWEKGDNKLVFNWHPLLMIVAFCFMTAATLAFRFPFRSLSRSQTKLVHGMSWTIAALSAAIALIAVFQSHNNGDGSGGGYIANLYSLHSWIGMLTILAYVAQWGAGVYFFWWYSSTSDNAAIIKAMVHQFHIVIGPILYFSVVATILLGIQEKEGFIGCSYKVDSPDGFPLPKLGQIPAVCRTGHTLGILVVLTAISSYAALFNHNISSARTTASPNASDVHRVD